MKTKLGRTNITVNKDGFGALPIQRTTEPEAGRILKAALDRGINFIDTARAYTDSEEKLGRNLSARRNEFFLATKTGAQTEDGFWKDLETSLRLLKTDHIDIYQFHNPLFVPKPDGPDGLYNAALKAQEQGKIRFIGITNHKLSLANEAVESGLYDTLQFPFSYLSNEPDVALVRLCQEKNMGFIAMKALSGGLITNIALARKWLHQFSGVVPIFGIQKMEELEQLAAAIKAGPKEAGGALSAEENRFIAHERETLGDAFCRGCGYCEPCTQGIILHQICRLPQMIRRSPPAPYLTRAWKAEMDKVATCVDCGECKKR
jgi:aryl-alcohol dehydrogenase-like predicted oxidoreductase